MENQLVSCRAETFPAGLRVLVVDDDPTWLKILEKMLRKCSYEVTTCGLARVALDILRERKDKFDIVISDVNMPDMDGFKLLEHVGLEMDLPVIMMSIDGETSRVMKGVQHGACDYLLKPVRMKELRNIWQHVYRKRMHEVKEIEGHNIHEDIYFLRNGSEDLEERHFFNGNDTGSLRKRKDVDTKEHADQDFNDPATVKKARVVWSVDLHQKFVNAVNQIGFDKVGPKKILDLMNVPGLTRENVASHLQKYRLYLSRLQKQNEGRSCSRNILSDCNNKDRDGSFGIQSSKEMEQDSVHTNYLSTKFQAQEVNTGIHVDDLRGLRNLPLTDNMKPLKESASGIQKTDNLSQLDAIFSSNNMAPNVGNKLCDPTSSEKKIWNEGLPVTQFMKYPKRIHERCNLLEDFSCLPKPDQEQQFVSSHLQSTSSIISITCNSENDTTGLCELKPVVTDYTSGCFAYIPPVTWAVDPVSIEIKHDLVNSQDIRANSELGGSPSIKDECFEQSYNNGHLPSAYDSSVKSGIDFDLLPEDLHLFALQGISCFKNADIDGRDVFEDNSTPATEFIQGNWYEGSEFNCENSYDLLDYPTDEFLFAQ